MSAIELQTGSEAQTALLAAALARLARPGDCLLLQGDLGAGKTAFARGFIQALVGEEEVVSPTFTLVQRYDAPGGAIHHFDLYRLRSAHELAEIGLDEALEGITLIEWPQLASGHLPAAALSISITAGADEKNRRFHLSGADNVWQQRLTELERTL